MRIRFQRKMMIVNHHYMLLFPLEKVKKKRKLHIVFTNVDL